MIVDAHSHLLADWTPGDELKSHPAQVPEFDPTAFDRLTEQLGVARVVTLAQEMTRLHRQWLGSNALVAAFQEMRPGKVIAMAGLEPLDERDLFHRKRYLEVREALRAGRVRGLLLTPPYGHYYANDPRCYPFYALAEEGRVPVYLHHSAQLGDASLAPLRFARPWLLDEVVADFAGLTIVVEHMGWPWTEELLAVMAHGPNVWTDISALNDRPHLLAWNLTMARDYGVLDRVIWGTDFVGNQVEEWAGVVRQEVAWLREELNRVLGGCGWPPLTKVELDGLLCDNACRLFRLAETEQS